MWRSKALYFKRKTRHHSECSNGCSRGLLFVGFSMVAKCKSPTCWNSSGQKKKLVLWPWCGYLCNFSWKAVKHTWVFPKIGVPPNHPFWVFHYKPSILGYPYFWKYPDVGRCLRWWLGIWQPCDTGLRPPFVGLGYMAKIENGKLPSWCFRGSWRPSGVWLHVRLKNLIIIFAHGSLSPPPWRVEWH